MGVRLTTRTPSESAPDNGSILTYLCSCPYKWTFADNVDADQKPYMTLIIGERLACWVKITADDMLKYFSYFSLLGLRFGALQAYSADVKLMIFSNLSL